METQFYREKKSTASLVILEDDIITNYSLSGKNEFFIGRKNNSFDTDIILTSAIASRRHMHLIQINNTWFIEDCGSVNGTYVNGKMLHYDKDNDKNELSELHNGDVIRIDNIDLNNPDSRGVMILFTTDSNDCTWVSYYLDNKDSVIIGRGESADIRIPEVYISETHSQIMRNGNHFYLSDCGSKTGTWLNGTNISQNVLLNIKDNISICNHHFIFTGNSLIYNIKKTNVFANNSENIPKTDSRNFSDAPNSQPAEVNEKPVILDAHIKCRKVPNNNGKGMIELIHDVNLKVRDSSLVALLGSSGAGKSTVMNCLNGMDTSGVEGTILFDNEDLIKNFERLKTLIGSVPQEAVLHDALRVEEELLGAAKLRLPKDTTKKELRDQVDKVIKQLGLEAKRKTPIKKCSGGEKQRVNIGIELVADRKLLCLDEPDAGLDPGTKRELFTILRNLAHNDNKSILVIIHDVSDIDLFDQIIIMTKLNDTGRLAFSGSPEEARKYFNEPNIKNVYDLLSENPEKYVRD